MTLGRMLAPVAAMVAIAAPAAAQSVPFADTEDATLSAVDVADGARGWHAIVSFDVRNGDYARGAFDDDAASLERVPLHVSVGGAVVLARGDDGDGRVFLIGQSSNGFHAPARGERTKPRGWYESNTLVGLAWRPVAGLDAAAAYTIKTSPNGVAATTHEASLSVLYSGDDWVGRLAPRAAVTRRTRGDGGLFTIAGIAPSFDLTPRPGGATLSVPVTVGVGWRGFYGPGSGSRRYASGGVALAQPVRLAGAAATVQAELLALVRDDRLRRRDAPGGTTAAVVPYATVSLRVGW